MSRSTRFASVLFAGLMSGHSFGYNHMAENGGRGGGKACPPPPNAPQIPGLTWEEFEVRTTDPETKKTKAVGTVVTPNFNEEDPQQGLQQIAAFPFAQFSNGKFRDFKHAIVAMINTQFGTHLRNWKRQEANPRVSMQVIQMEAMKRMAEDQQGATIRDALDPTKGGGPEKFMALQQQWIERVKAEYRAAGKLGGSSASQAEGNEQEENDTEAVTAAGGVAQPVA